MATKQYTGFLHGRKLVSLHNKFLYVKGVRKHNSLVIRFFFLTLYLKKKKKVPTLIKHT